MIPRVRTLWLAGALGLAGLSAPTSVAEADSKSGYALVVSTATHANPAWREVVEALAGRHQAQVLVVDSLTAGVQPLLRALQPRFLCLVARPEEVTRQWVAEIHQLSRRLDDDPYPDCFWGILTGYDAANALRIARHHEPLTVRKVASGTEVALDACEEGVWYCELQQGRMVRKEKGGEPARLTAPPDTTEALVNSLNEYQADLFVTSGHATERDWQIGFAYPNGTFRCENGALYGLDTQGRRLPVQAPEARVYLPIGNCLMGHIDSTNAMALAFLNSAGVNQMIGYTVPTWYGYMGWGMLDYFVEQPGRFTMSEAFRANAIALTHRLQTFFPDLVDAETTPGVIGRTPIKPGDAARQAGLTAQDARGLLFDRDVVAFYGDPAWQARMADRPKAWNQSLRRVDDVYTFECTPNRGDQSFEPVNRNGVQRGYRPIIKFFPRRLSGVQILEGAELKPVIADDFLLLPQPRPTDSQPRYRVRFRAQPAG